MGWKLLLLEIVLFIFVLWADHLVLYVLFMTYVILDLIHWAHNNPSYSQICGFIDTHVLDDVTDESR